MTNETMNTVNIADGVIEETLTEETLVGNNVMDETTFNGETLTPIKPVHTKATVWAENIANAQKGDGTVNDFKNVNGKWMATTISFDEGMELLTKGRAETEDIELPLEEVDFTESEGKLVIVIGNRKFNPTEHALRQLGTKLGVPTKILINWYQGDQTDIMVVGDILANGKRRILEAKETVDEDGNAIEPSDWLWRTRKDGSLRAALSKKFAKLDNLWFLESLKKILPGGRLSHWDKGDSDSIYGNILTPDSLRKESDSDYSGGVSVTNSEIGLASLSCNPWLYRFICCNGMIHSKIEGISYIRKHLGSKINYEAQFEKLKDCIIKQIPLIDSHINNLLDTKKFVWSDTVTKLLAQTANDLLLSKKQATELITSYNIEPDLSCFGLINAITRASQKMPSDVWYSMDSYASFLVNEINWSNYSRKAMAMSQKDAESYFVNVS